MAIVSWMVDWRSRCRTFSKKTCNILQTDLLFIFSNCQNVFPYIKATKDLENFDKERHDEFKRYEMMKEHDRREHLKSLDDEERKKEEEHYEELRKKHADHPKVNHPVSLI